MAVRRLAGRHRGGPRLTLSESRRTVDPHTEAMDFLSVLVVVGAVAALLQWVTSRRTVAALDLFASGFLPYRSDDGWPQGVQEADPVPWSWTPPAAAPTEERPVEAVGDVEIVEITRGAVPVASPVHREPLHPGSASRPH